MLLMNDMREYYAKNKANINLIRIERKGKIKAPRKQSKKGGINIKKRMAYRPNLEKRHTKLRSGQNTGHRSKRIRCGE